MCLLTKDLTLGFSHLNVLVKDPMCNVKVITVILWIYLSVQRVPLIVCESVQQICGQIFSQRFGATDSFATVCVDGDN